MTHTKKILPATESAAIAAYIAAHGVPVYATGKRALAPGDAYAIDTGGNPRGIYCIHQPDCIRHD